MKAKTTKTGNLPEPRKWSEAWWRKEYNLPTNRECRRRAETLERKASRQGLKLKRCTKERRCGLFSCPVCRRKAQMAFIKTYRPEMKRRARKHELFFLTIIPEYGVARWGHLPGRDLKTFIDQVRATLRRNAPEAFGVFCVDVSLELGPDGSFAQWHVHGVIGGVTEKEKTKIANAFKWKGEPNVKAVWMPKVKDLRRCIAYSAKCNFFSRESCIDDDDEPNIRSRQLTIEQELALVRNVTRYKAASRMFTLGMKRR